jgi:2-desacetyl-2-hydroxyethyl bacteriochlorophyllide A dehydrogenase
VELMKAARFYGPGQPLRLEEVPVPQPGPHEVLVQTKACGICGSDQHIVFEGTTETAFRPITLGHEPSGVVAGVGPEVEGLEPGTPVSVVPDVACGHCLNCVAGHSELCVSRRLIGIHLDGALAEYFVVPARNCVPIPAGVSFPEAAVITDAVATPYHALHVGHLRAGQMVAVLGLGGLGIHAIMLARLAGASRVLAVGSHTASKARAARAGADLVLGWDPDPVQELRRATDGQGVDLALDFLGTGTSVTVALAALRPGGRLVVVGLSPEPAPIPTRVVVRHGLTIYGSYGCTRNDVRALLELRAQGRLDLSGSITHTYRLDEVNQALEQLNTKAGNPLRIVVEV